jgi:hypothetical protein
MQPHGRVELLVALQVGFTLVTAYDAATIAIGPNRPWFERLTQFRHLHYVDDVIIKVRHPFSPHQSLFHRVAFVSVHGNTVTSDLHQSH